MFFLTHPCFFSCLFVYFCVKSILFSSVGSHGFIDLDSLLNLLSHEHILPLLDLLLLKDLPLPLQLHLLLFHIPASLPDNVGGSLPSLINFANRLYSNNLKSEKLTLDSSYFSNPIRLHKSLRSSSARLRAIFAATNLRWRVASSSSSYGVRSISSI